MVHIRLAASNTSTGSFYVQHKEESIGILEDVNKFMKTPVEASYVIC